MQQPQDSRTESNNDMESSPPALSPSGSAKFSIVRVLTLVVVIVGVAAAVYGIRILTEKPVVLVKFSGRVMFNGKPVTVGGMATQRVDDDRDGGVSAFDEEGRFDLKTDGKPGAYVGRHKVVISSMTPTMPPSPLTPSVYASMATTPLFIDVSENPAENQKEFVLAGALPGSAAAKPAEEPPAKPAQAESVPSDSQPETTDVPEKAP